MKSKRFTNEQIIRILHEVEAGVPVTDICRKHNCSEQSQFNVRLVIYYFSFKILAL